MSTFRTEQGWFRGIYPPSLIEAVAVFSVLQRLGFDPGQINLGIVKDRVFVILKDELHQLPICVGETELETPEMTELWARLAKEWNEGGSVTSEEKKKLYGQTRVKAQVARIALAIKNAGFAGKQ